ncbi:hypothetical protein N8456_06010 [Porticoccaceae bacterium]|nr:hypothetical protein [Porticoccaceae bacterium]
MPIQPKDLVAYAEDILKYEGCETHYRNVIGRAYYGAFLTARNKAQKMSDEKFDGGGAHSKLVKFYMGIDETIGNMLDVMRRSRIHADYQLDKKFGYYDANICCTRAKKLLKECQRDI